MNTPLDRDYVYRYRTHGVWHRYYGSVNWWIDTSEIWFIHGKRIK